MYAFPGLCNFLIFCSGDVSSFLTFSSSFKFYNYRSVSSNPELYRLDGSPPASAFRFNFELSSESCELLRLIASKEGSVSLFWLRESLGPSELPLFDRSGVKACSAVILSKDNKLVRQESL